MPHHVLDFDSKLSVLPKGQNPSLDGNLVGPENFSIQGYLRDLIYPDFIVQKGKNKKPISKVLVVESKGCASFGKPGYQLQARDSSLF